MKTPGFDNTLVHKHDRGEVLQSTTCSTTLSLYLPGLISRVRWQMTESDFEHQSNLLRVALHSCSTKRQVGGVSSSAGTFAPVGVQSVYMIVDMIWVFQQIMHFSGRGVCECVCREFSLAVSLVSRRFWPATCSTLHEVYTMCLATCLVSARLIAGGDSEPSWWTEQFASICRGTLATWAFKTVFTPSSRQITVPDMWNPQFLPCLKDLHTLHLRFDLCTKVKCLIYVFLSGLHGLEEIEKNPRRTFSDLRGP